MKIKSKMLSFSGDTTPSAFAKGRALGGGGEGESVMLLIRKINSQFLILFKFDLFVFV